MRTSGTSGAENVIIKVEGIRTARYGVYGNQSNIIQTVVEVLMEYAHVVALKNGAITNR